jgi:hypothetical protein
MSRSLLFAVALLCPTAAFAALDPEVKQPYRLRVVLHIGKHRLLTPVFKDQIERELRDGLQAALGDMAHVEVVREHPRLREIQEKGLLALDGWKELADLKTHFVLIDFVNDQYEVQARQYDGLTGQVSPLRREQVPDRGFVARTAGLLMAHDFGLVGTVTDPGDGKAVRVTIRGGGLGVPLERWVKKGDVFALVRINQGSAGPWAVRVPWALLQAEEAPKDGACVCRLYYRHPEPLAMGPGVLGYRCIKLGTTRGPLRLRFVEASERAPTPQPGLQVRVRHYGFTGEDSAREEGTTNADGFFQAGRDRPFENLAFVTVLDGNIEKARIPVAIVDDRPVVIPISVKAEASAPLQFRRNLWLQRIYENLLVQAELFKQLNDLAARPDQRKRALERAQAGLKALQTDIDHAAREMGNLRTALKELPGGTSIDLSDGEQRLRDLQKIQQQLQEFIAGLETVIKEENDPKRQELLARIERGGLLENDADFGGALKLYEEVLQSGIEFPKLQERVKKLRDTWEVKDAAHRQARAFLYEVWPKLELAGLKARLPEALAALAECKRVGDTLSPQKLLKAAVAHVAKLNKQEQELNPVANPDDAKTAETIAAVREALGKLIQEVNAFLDPQGK